MRLLIALLALSVLAACEKSASAASPASAAPAVKAPRGVLGTEAKGLVAAGALLLDVRTVDEFQELHVPGATNIPLDQLTSALARIPKGKPVVVYCAVGSRSSVAASLLAQRGYEVLNLGAMGNWNR